MPKQPEKKIHSSGTRKDAEKIKAEKVSNYVRARALPKTRDANTRTWWDGLNRTSGNQVIPPANSSIKRADKEGRYKPEPKKK